MQFIIAPMLRPMLRAGLTHLSLEPCCRRQGTRAEIVLAKRSEKGPVAQGVLLEQGAQY